MSDLISRQAAIDEIRTMQTYKLFAGDDMLLVDQAEAMTNLMMMPTAEPRWRLSAEELPDCNEEVLVCYISRGWICIDELDGDGTFVYWDGSNWEVDDTAWMPLPEPFREEESE